MYVVGNSITINWRLKPTTDVLIAEQFDITVIEPDGAATYTDNGLTDFTAPTETTGGLLVYTLAVPNPGLYTVILSTGSGDSYQAYSTKRFYIFNSPYFPAGVNEALAPDAYFGELTLPNNPPSGYEDSDGNTTQIIELPDGGGDALPFDIAYTTADHTFGFSNAPVIIRLDSGALDLAVPSDWTGFTQFSSVREAFQHAHGFHIQIAFLDMPTFPGLGDNYLFSPSLITNGGRSNYSTIYCNPDESYTNFLFRWDTYALGSDYLEDNRVISFRSDGGSGNGQLPAEWDNVLMPANSRIGIRLSNDLHPVLPNRTADVTDVSFPSPNYVYGAMTDGTTLMIGMGTEIRSSTDWGETFSADINNSGNTQTKYKSAYGNSCWMFITNLGIPVRSTDGGANWTTGTAVLEPHLPGGGVQSLFSLKFYPIDNNFLAGVYRYSGGAQHRLYRSADNGSLWNPVNITGLSHEIAHLYPYIYNDGVATKIYFVRYLTGIYEIDNSSDDTPTLTCEVGVELYTMMDDTSGNLPIVVSDIYGRIYCYNGTTLVTHNLPGGGVQYYSDMGNISDFVYMPYTDEVLAISTKGVVYSCSVASLMTPDSFQTSNLGTGTGTGIYNNNLLFSSAGTEAYMAKTSVQQKLDVPAT